MHRNVTGTSVKINCPAGRFYSSATGQCISCPAGQYSSSAGSTSCDLCPAGRYSNIGSANCISCPAGQYSPPGSSSSTSCFSCTPDSHQCCWVLASWTIMGKAIPTEISSSDNSCCTKHMSGIACDFTTTKVTLINWNAKNLSNSMPKELLMLNSLTQL
jgi:hypothetical protein